MRVLSAIILTVFTLTDPTLVSRINNLKAEAKKAYLKNDFKTAIKHYRTLVDSLNVHEDEVLINLASAYYNSRDTANAISQYQALTASSKNQLRSKAQQQLGIIADQQGKSEEALNYFKQAIKSDLTNDDARYNYELLKKKIEEQKKQDQKDQKDKDDQNKDKDQEKKDQEKKDQEKKDQEKKDQEQKEKEKQEQEQKEKEKQKKDQEKKDQEQKDKEEEEKEDQKKEEEKKMPPSVKEKLEEMKISPEKAEMLLEAMRNQEKQYLQQNKRKATKPKEKNKPDW